MKTRLLGLVLAAALALPATSVLAADLDAPPPVDDLRPATYDWSGASVGLFAAALAVDGHYNNSSLCGCVGTDPEMSGIGYGGGIQAALNYQFDSFVFGIAGDWTFAGKIADNDDPAEATFMNYNNIGTLRARAGLASDNTLFYVTGGAAGVDTEFGGLVGPASEKVSDSKSVYGWTVGGGIEHAFTDNLTASLEYLYISLPDKTYTLVDSMGNGGNSRMIVNDMHMIKAGLNYKMNWY